VTKPEQQPAVLTDGQEVRTGEVVSGLGVAVFAKEYAVVIPFLQVLGSVNRQFGLASAEVIKAYLCTPRD